MFGAELLRASLFFNWMSETLLFIHQLFSTSQSHGNNTRNLVTSLPANVFPLKRRFKTLYLVLMERRQSLSVYVL